MSVESEILRIQHNVADTYAQVAEKGGNVPLQPNSANLAAAVASIPEGGGSGDGVTMEDVNAAIAAALAAYTPQQVYSTQEVRIGTWLDGKPLYRKCIFKASINSNSYVPFDFSGKEVKMFYGYGYQSNGQISSLNCFFDSSNYSDLTAVPGDSGFYIHFYGRAFDDSPAAIIAEYTKTTDQPEVN